MKTSRPNSRRSLLGFTLIELLVVIAIIAILAAMLFPAIGVAKRKAAEASARADMKNIELAISRYEADYNGRFPAPRALAGAHDATYGFYEITNAAPPTIAGVTNFVSNAGVIAVLLDLEYTREEPTPQRTDNYQHVLNPRRISNLNAKFAKEGGGVHDTLDYCDPWGNPYVISMDVNMDDRCRDNNYGRRAVSQESGQRGYYGLFNSVGSGNSDQFEFNGKFMIWSRGADGKASSSVNAKTGVNKDNLLSWDQ